MATTPKISQRISLEGAEQIKESLDKLGAAGKKAFSELKTAVDSANQSIDSAGKDIKAKLDGVAKAGEGAAESIFTVGQKAVLAVGGIVAIGTALVSLARSYLNAADAAAKLVSAQVAAATRAGQTRQNYERQIGTLEQLGLTHAEAEQAIKKFGAGGAEAYAKGVAELKKLGISFAPTEAGAKAASQMLGNLGTAAKDAGGKVGGATELIRRAKAVFDPLTGTLTQDQTAWENLAESVSKIQDPLQRATFLTAQFGDDLGRRLSKALSGGAAAFRKEAEDFNRISGNLSKEQVQQQNDAASAYEKAMARWTAAAQGVRTRGGLKVAEAVTPFINMMVEAELQFEKAQESFLQEGSNRFETTRRELQAIHEFLSLPLPEAWRRYSRAANEAFDQAVAAAQRGAEAIRGFVTEKVADAWNWVSETAAPAWNRAKAVADAVITSIRSTVTQGVAGAWQWISNTAAAAWNAVTAMAAQVFNAVATYVTQGVGGAWQWVSGTASAAWDAVKAKATEVYNAIASLVTTAPAAAFQWVTDIWSGVTTTVLAAIDRLIASAIAKFAALKRALFDSAETGGSTGAPEPFARGGQFRGRPGRDTNLAWLTDKEYVMQVPAVKKYGVGFMRMINSMALPRDAFRGFNAGGLVDGLNRSMSALMIPHFNAGGLADMVPAGAAVGGRPFILQVGGKNHHAVISGPPSTIRVLEREALAAQAASTGRKPSWVR